MSIVKIKCHTKEDGSISVKIKGECSFEELKATTGYMMASIVANEDIEALDEIVANIKKGIEDES